MGGVAASKGLLLGKRMWEYIGVEYTKGLRIDECRTMNSERWRKIHLELK
jgi:hypothetical protein